MLFTRHIPRSSNGLPVPIKVVATSSACRSVAALGVSSAFACPARTPTRNNIVILGRIHNRVRECPSHKIGSGSLRCDLRFADFCRCHFGSIFHGGIPQTRKYLSRPRCQGLTLEYRWILLGTFRQSYQGVTHPLPFPSRDSQTLSHLHFHEPRVGGPSVTSPSPGWFCKRHGRSLAGGQTLTGGEI